MHDEITHLRVVHRRLRLRLPRGIGAGIIGKDADDVEGIEIMKLHFLDTGEFAAENENAGSCFLVVVTSLMGQSTNWEDR